MLLKKTPYLIILLIIISCKNERETTNLKLWYDEPAERWTEALPIGNGRIGAMVYGGVNREHIQFNEETLWTGKPRNYNREGAANYLDEIRRLLLDGKQKAAEELAGRVFMGTRSNEENYASELALWKEKVNLETEKLSSLEYDDSDWMEMPVAVVDGWESIGYPSLDGSIWMRFSFHLPDDWQGRDLILNLGRIMNEDITYVNGSQVGAESNPYAHRRYQVPASLFNPGKNVIAVHIFDYYDKGGMVGFKTGEPMVVYPKGGEFTEGIDLSTPWKCFFQDTNPPEYPQYLAAYQPFGDLEIEFSNYGDEIKNYRRELDISNAITSVSYEIKDIEYSREYFVSAPEQALFGRFETNEPGKINFTLRFDAIHEQWVQSNLDDQTIQLKVQVKNGALRGVANCKVHVEEGSVKVKENGIEVSNASTVIFALTAATNYKSYADVSGNPEAAAMSDLSSINLFEYDEIRKNHIQDYQQYFNRFNIDLAGDQTDSLTTDQRLVKFQKTQDPALLALYVQYGRYLLISSSRQGTNPANLQGIWNDDLTPPWGSKYTTNINAEMNYWTAEPLNLSDLHKPLFTMIEEVAAKGRETAKTHYGLDGWVLHHNTDIWRGTAPVNHANHGIWPTGGAWLCEHLWQHFEYTRDTAFLKERAYPIMKGSAQFFMDYLVEDAKTGYLMSGPSNSPENGGLVMGPTMDHQIIRSLFENNIEAAEILKIDHEFAEKLKTKLNRIAPNRIGQYGQLQEWMEDKDDPNNKHRHVSHLWGVYPDDQINIHTPELLDAAKKSLEFRGDDGTGWSLAWKINLWARLRDGDHAWTMINNLFRPAWVDGKRGGGSYKNLFDAHPPFQIDGNFGAAAGVAEMLIQMEGDTIVLLPALPVKLAKGKIDGLRIPGNIEANIAWSDGSLEQFELLSEHHSTLYVKYQNKTKVIKLASNELQTILVE